MALVGGSARNLRQHRSLQHPQIDPRARTPPPALIESNKPEISRFARHIHHNIAHKLLALIALALELPEDSFISSHRYDVRSDCHLRYMKYHACDAAPGDVWMEEHTDVGSLTLLFRQPVAALQVRMPYDGDGDGGGKWKWVRPRDGSITVNVGDTLQFLTNGFLRSSIHRVVAPPLDQAGVDRLGVLYFVRPEDDLVLKPVESPVLERLGYKPEESTCVGEGIRAGD